MGNGSSNDERKTAFEVLADGRARIQTAPEDEQDVVNLGTLWDTYTDVFYDVQSLIPQWLTNWPSGLRVEITNASLEYGVSTHTDPTASPATYTYDSTLEAIDSTITFSTHYLKYNEETGYFELEEKTFTDVPSLISYITKDLELTTYTCEMDYYGVKFQLNVAGTTEALQFCLIGGRYVARRSGSSTVMDILPYQGNNSEKIMKVVYYYYLTQK